MSSRPTLAHHLFLYGKWLENGSYIEQYFEFYVHHQAIPFYFVTTSTQPSFQNKKSGFLYAFKAQWSVNYFDTEFDDKSSIPELKYNIHWHYQKKHSSQYFQLRGKELSEKSET